jgi:hypothetical protein
MFKHITLAAVITIAAATVLTAQSSTPYPVIIDTATMDACVRKAVFARTINQSSYDYYDAHDCEIVYADRVTVALPSLTGTGIHKITVRNVGTATIVVEATAPDVIDASVLMYSNSSHPWLPQGTAILCCAEQAFYLPPQKSATFESYHGPLANSWFTTSDR